MIWDTPYIELEKDGEGMEFLLIASTLNVMRK